jgi:hypothetical protein
MTTRRTKINWDHLALTPVARELIQIATGDSKTVQLMPMDKGLSGSSVWQARWHIPSLRNVLSDLHVFKIGNKEKLFREYENINHIAQHVSKEGVPPSYFAESKIDSGQAILRLKYVGSLTGSTFSLRHFMQNRASVPFAATGESVQEVINNLYRNALKKWHFSSGYARQRKSSIAEAVNWWPKKIALRAQAEKLGFDALNRELLEWHNLSIQDICEQVENTLHKKRKMFFGPVHGDLHATNVNLDDRGNIYVIDYGNTTSTWRALDFIVLEAAIKFATAPSHVPLRTFLDHEEYFSEMKREEDLSSTLYENEMRLLRSAVNEIRRCCFDANAEPDIKNYYAGLVCIAAAFTSIEWLVNRRFLFHSIAHYLKRAN